MAKLSQKSEISYEQYCKALHTVKLYSKQIAIHQTEVQMDIASISRFLSVSEDMKIEDLPISIRTLNLLQRMAGIDLSKSTLKDLELLSLTELARQKNAGNRTMFEIEELCLYTGIQMLP